jgi:hypothetical protein
MPIYENLVIGNFLYALGLKIGARQHDYLAPDLAVNQIQQTPIDFVLGDVLLVGPRAVALLEFKREADRRTKEAEKLVQIEALLERPRFQVLQKTSRQIHFYVETSDILEEEGFRSRVLPYLDLRTDDRRSCLEQLIDNLALHAMSAPALTEMDRMPALPQTCVQVPGPQRPQLSRFPRPPGGGGRGRPDPLCASGRYTRPPENLRSDPSISEQVVPRDYSQNSGRHSPPPSSVDLTNLSANPKTLINMRNDQILSAEELEDLAETASTLVNLAKQQQFDCDALLRKLETAMNAFESRTTELTLNMPNKIAQQAAQEVVARIDASVARSVADVLRPVETKAQTLLRAMDEAMAEYRRAAAECRRQARNAVLTCIIAAAVSAVLVLLATMKIADIV